MCWILQKQSFHLIWSQTVVDKDRAHRIRLSTVEKFERLSNKEPLAAFHNLQALDVKNTWDVAFCIRGPGPALA